MAMEVYPESAVDHADCHGVIIYVTTTFPEAPGLVLQRRACRFIGFGRIVFWVEYEHEHQT